MEVIAQEKAAVPETAEKFIQDVRRKTRRKFSAEEKIRIVLDGLRGEHSIAELRRREGIAEGLYYSWSKEFLEAGDDHKPASPQDMVTWFARGLLDVQTQVDEHGWLRDGYPASLQRGFDLAAASSPW